MPSPPPQQNDESSNPPLNPQAWLAAVIDSSDDAIVTKTLEGVVTTWNKSAERIFGYAPQEIIGKPILTIIPPDRQHEEVEILRRLRNGQRVDHFETVRRRKDGSLIDISVTISPIRDTAGRIIGVSKIARDITLWKRVQAELTSAKEAAEQARSTAEDLRRQAEAANRSKDHFLSVLSHELRTPLTPALAAIGLLEKDATLPENTREQIGMIRRNVETEARLMDDLLDLTRIARGKMALHPEVIDTHAVIRNVVAMFQKEIDEKSLAVRLALRARDRHVWADAGRFQQVMLNLMSNAVKFTPNDGEITFSSSNEGDTLQIDVADTGIGIEADVVPRLFSAFEQGEKSFARRFGGLGLGLSIVKSLVAMHNGTVTVFSAGKGRGATFTIRLPVTRAHGEHSSSCGAAAVAMLPKNFRALLVEDHDDTRQVMGLLLRNFGCTVTSAASVKEATQLADRNHFDLLVCDFGLPDGTGADVIRHLHRQYQIKGIAITGFGQDEDLRRSKEAGFSVHLTKPINIDALHQAIREVATE